MHQYKARFRRRGLLSSVESQKIVAELENDMEDIVCEVMQPQVVNYPPFISYSKTVYLIVQGRTHFVVSYG